MLSKAHDYLWCLVNEKQERSLALQNPVEHTPLYLMKENNLKWIKKKNV